MRNLHNETITNAIIEEVEKNFKFVNKPNFKKYNLITITEDFIEIVKEEKWERDENLEYKKIADEEIRQFTKNNVSGVFVEC